MSSVDISPLLTSSLDNELYPRSDWPPRRKKREKNPYGVYHKLLYWELELGATHYYSDLLIEIFQDNFQLEALFC